MFWRTGIIITFIFLHGTDAVLEPPVHITPQAQRPPNDLICYRCTASEEGDSCADVIHNRSRDMQMKCSDDKRLCMVKRFSYTTANENSTSTLRMWSMERNCTKHCTPGCIVIGERTKLYACTSCCTKSFCNTGSFAVPTTITNPIGLFFHNLLFLLFLKY